MFFKNGVSIDRVYVYDNYSDKQRPLPQVLMT